MANVMTNPYRKSVVRNILREGKEKVLEKTADETGQWNPRIPGSASRFFDRRGQINAHDRKDLSRLIDVLLTDKDVGNTLDAWRKVAYRKDAELDPFLRREVILNALKTESGRIKLGEELLAPIKNVLDYEGIARKFLRIRPLAQGEVHRIAKDIWVVAYMVGQDGQTVVSEGVGRYVYPKDFKVVSFIEVDINDIYQMHFDVLDRGQDLAKQMIMLQEDKGLVAAFDKAATAVNTPVYFTNFTLGTFEDLRFQVERHRLVADKFLVNRQEVSSFLKGMHNDVDFVTERELIMKGYIANVLGVKVVMTAGVGVQEVVPRGTVYVCAEGSFLGEMGIRLDLQAQPYDTFALKKTTRGWSVFEIINQTVVNPRAIAKGVRQ